MFEIRLLDSFAFMASSLCSLVENLNPEYEQLQTLDKNFEKHYGDNYDKKTYLNSYLEIK